MWYQSSVLFLVLFVVWNVAAVVVFQNLELYDRMVCRMVCKSCAAVFQNFEYYDGIVCCSLGTFPKFRIVRQNCSFYGMRKHTDLSVRFCYFRWKKRSRLDHTIIVEYPKSAINVNHLPVVLVADNERNEYYETKEI